MEEVLDVVVLGRACRNTANIKNRQPIGTMYVKAPKVMDKYFTDIIADELNVKEVKFAEDVESFISYSFKPQLRTVGPKYGKLLGGIRTALAQINGSQAMNQLKTNGVLVLDIDGNKVELTEEDLLIETAQSEGYVTETEGETAVVLDTNLTPELIEEGFVREIISKVQTMRKEAGFEVMDKIRVSVKDNDKIIETMKANEAEIKSEVLAEEVVYGETDGYVKEWNINKEHAMCVRGINHIVPHAFSPASFPDPDCPPHFYARGFNPQFREFHQWSTYTNRVCERISGGKHIAPVAVLYHAETEWGGKYQPFEEVVKLLMQNQIDCEVVWCDLLTDLEKSCMKDGVLQINGESFRVLLVPYAEYLPQVLTERLREFSEEGLSVIFLKDYPKRSYFSREFIPREGMLKSNEETLIPLLENLNIRDIIPMEKKEQLAYYHYRKENIDWYFFVNEGLTDTIFINIRFRDKREACFYDPMTGEFLKAVQRVCLSGEEERREVEILLRPYESIFVVFGENTEVYETVVVWLNGQKVGEVICPPYRFYLPEGSLFPGENEIVIEVTNTLAKAHHENSYDRYWVQEPTGLLGPVEILWK